MYRILLVDDELEALQYFGRMFRENLSRKYEIDVYSVDSAQKAMDYLRENKVDLVVTDIQMPGMNGVEMYQQIKKTWPRSRFLFLTGFMDFDYVYSTAAQDSNTRFLTKLEPAEKIVATVEAMIEELETSYQEKELMQQAVQQMQEAFPLFQHRCLGQYLYGKGKKELIQTELQKYHLNFLVDMPLTLIGAVVEGAERSDSEEEYLQFALKTILNSEFSKDYYIFHYLADGLEEMSVWLMQSKSGDVRRVQDILESIQNVFLTNMKHTVSFAYGQTSGDYLENPRLYRKICTALGYRNREISENLIPCNIQEAAGSTVWEDYGLQKSWNKLVHMDELENFLEMGQEKSFFDLFAQMTEHMENVESMNYTLAQEIYYKIAVLLLRYINLWRLNEKMAFQMEMYKLMRPDLHEGWAAGVAFLRRTAELIFELYFETERIQLSDYVTNVRDYIRDHLSEDLSLVALADQIHLNASYLSRLFKKETGEKLYDYVTSVRMQKAAELLLEGELKVQEIAQMVGYETVQSFNRAFKKYTGEAPGNYRSEVKKR